MMQEDSGFPIGMAPEDEEFSQQTILLQPGDRLLFYSDGLTDAMNREGEVFGAARLLEASGKLKQRPLEEMVRSLMADVDGWTAGAEGKEDISVLVAEVTASQ